MYSGKQDQLLTYEKYVLMQIAEHKIAPGDEIRVVLRNEEQKESMFEQAHRSMEMFLMCYHFFPAEIHIHSSHLAGIKAQGKTLDVMLSKAMSELGAQVADLSTFPKRIPLLADDSLDPFTTVACYTLSMEKATEAITELLSDYLQRHRT